MWNHLGILHKDGLRIRVGLIVRLFFRLQPNAILCAQPTPRRSHISRAVDGKLLDSSQTARCMHLNMYWMNMARDWHCTITRGAKVLDPLEWDTAWFYWLTVAEGCRLKFTWTLHVNLTCLHLLVLLALLQHRYWLQCNREVSGGHETPRCHELHADKEQGLIILFLHLLGKWWSKTRQWRSESSKPNRKITIYRCWNGTYPLQWTKRGQLSWSSNLQRCVSKTFPLECRSLPYIALT